VLLRQLIESLIVEAVNPQRILYIAFDELPTLRDLDEPVLAIARWYESHAVAVGTARPVYQDPREFFALTYPTLNLRELAKDVVLRLAGRNDKIVKLAIGLELAFALRVELGGAARPRSAACRVRHRSRRGHRRLTVGAARNAARELAVTRRTRAERLHLPLWGVARGGRSAIGSRELARVALGLAGR
jgi:hypothetical protein